MSRLEFVTTKQDEGTVEIITPASVRPLVSGLILAVPRDAEGSVAPIPQPQWLYFTGQGDHVNVLLVAKFLYSFCAPGMEQRTTVDVHAGCPVRGTGARTQTIT